MRSYFRSAFASSVRPSASSAWAVSRDGSGRRQNAHRDRLASRRPSCPVMMVTRRVCAVKKARVAQDQFSGFSSNLGSAARDPHLASAARARCRSIRWRHLVYSLMPGRDSNDLHHSSSESSRCIDEQLLSTSAANSIANLKITATSRQAMTPALERVVARIRCLQS